MRFRVYITVLFGLEHGSVLYMSVCDACYSCKIFLSERIRTKSGRGMAALSAVRHCADADEYVFGSVVILVISQNRGFHYGGYLIYIMAMYAFYVTIMAVVNLVRYRKYRSPVISASRAVNLAAALVSMLSLETAMLTQFDTGSNMPYFRQIMVGTTGGAVCFIVVVMGIYMSVHAAKQLKIENRNLKG